MVDGQPKRKAFLHSRRNGQGEDYAQRRVVTPSNEAIRRTATLQLVVNRLRLSGLRKLALMQFRIETMSLQEFGMCAALDNASVL